MASMGEKFRKQYHEQAASFAQRIEVDSSDLEALLGLAESNIYLFIFGLDSRESTIPEAHWATSRALAFDSTSSKVLTVKGMLHMLDWEWKETKNTLRAAIKADPQNAKARHWYSLCIYATTGDPAEPFAQNDTIMTFDQAGDWLIGRGSLMYFDRQNENLRDLMLETIARDSSVPWGYDWLGMAYIEMEEYEKSLDTYFKAFEMADGLVEVGGGLGHALGLAGERALAKQMADFYEEQSSARYLPQCQRAFIHIGIGEYDKALDLLEEAYEKRSWFLIFMDIEPWYDPIRDAPRFQALVSRMHYSG